MPPTGPAGPPPAQYPPLGGHSPSGAPRIEDEGPEARNAPPGPGDRIEAAEPATEQAAPDEPAPDDADQGAISDPGDPEPTSPAVQPDAEPADQLGRMCPYLLSEDGTYRSTAPDPSHRCTAQDPPGSLPTAFQERFCLTDRYVRCEMYKYAQSTRSTALGGQGIPEEQMREARFRPAVRSVPVALGPAAGGNDGRSRRAAIVAAAGIAAVAIIVFLIVIALGGGGDDPPGAAVSPTPAAPGEGTTRRTPEPTPTPPPAPTPTPEPGATPGPTEATAGQQLEILYEVQEGEALRKIADQFGITRRRIIRSNEGMAERTPYVETGDIIIVPIPSDMTIEELEAMPGYRGLAGE